MIGHSPHDRFKKEMLKVIREELGIQVEEKSCKEPGCGRASVSLELWGTHMVGQGLCAPHMFQGLMESGGAVTSIEQEAEELLRKVQDLGGNSPDFGERFVVIQGHIRVFLERLSKLRQERNALPSKRR